MKTFATLAIVATLSALTIPASAGERSAISSLPVLPDVKDATTPPPLLGVPGLKFENKTTQYSKYTEVTAAKAKGYCLVQWDAGFIHLQLSESISGGVVEEMWHFVETDGKASLERIRFEMSLDSAWVRSKSSAELRSLATSDGITVWGLREPDGSVLVFARGATSGREASSLPKDHEQSELVGSDCTFGATRLDARAIAKGAAAQLSGNVSIVAGDTDDVPGKKLTQRFVVDISASKLSRDPESMLSVRVRRREP